ncbi:MAG: hypothetical protein A3G21_00250 [Acidobacteria bacterium RIFCSPLOWO2_12_FULL_66_21]|nr:MAG: hypothetical protein A3G21_00250 [Acidobacteria bacterium RIFCSPLOWO2_12_FULL_66_21]
MMVRKNVAEILRNHVTFELEAIDRMYLNAYVPSLQTGGGVVYFLKTQLGVRVPSTVMVAPMSQRFVEAIERFVKAEGVDLITFEKGQRKDDIAQKYLATFTGKEGVLFVGKAQEKASVFRTEKRRDARGVYPWIIRSTAMVNHYYVYLVDKDFGPLFIKFCSYFPYPAKLCLNGHEWLKRQLTQREVPFEPLDNGIRSSDKSARVQRIADTLDAAKIEAVFRKWLRRLPHPFAAAHRAAGYRYQLSILQAEFALTQVLDRPLTGRCFFEEVIRENLDIGRPDQMQLIFDRRVTRRTPGRFRTRVLTDGVVPSLHVQYKKSKVKQDHKEGQALRTETTINDTYDFRIGRALRNLPALREIGFAANRRLLRVESLSHDCLIGEDRLHAVTSPVVVHDQRAAGLRFGDRRVHALMHALCLVALAPTGFRHREFRDHLAQLQGRDPETYSAGSMTYDLRRLRLHGLIERVPRSHRYRITPTGAQVAMFYARLYTRALRPACSLQPSGSPSAQRAFDRLDAALAQFLEEVKLAA